MGTFGFTVSEVVLIVGWAVSTALLLYGYWKLNKQVEELNENALVTHARVDIQQAELLDLIQAKHGPEAVEVAHRAHARLRDVSSRSPQ